MQGEEAAPPSASGVDRNIWPGCRSCSGEETEVLSVEATVFELGPIYGAGNES